MYTVRSRNLKVPDQDITIVGTHVSAWLLLLVDNRSQRTIEESFAGNKITLLLLLGCYQRRRVLALM
jgi:hypothetical protein